MNLFKVLLLVLLSGSAIGQYNYKWERHDIDAKSSIRGLCAVSGQIVWVGGSNGLVARTIDGGKSWERLPVEGGESLDFRDVQAFDENTAIIMSSGPAQKSKVYKTVNGGQTWDLVHVNTYKDGFFNGIAFLNKKNGVLAGDPVDGNLYIALTNDGGDTWEKLDSYYIPEIEYQEFGFAASGTHITVYGDSSVWIGTGGKSARVFYSNDIGQSWEVYNTPMIQGPASAGIFSIAFKDHLNGVAVGGDYTKENEGRDNIIITKNRGKNWSLIDDHVEFRSCVQYIDGMYIAVGPSGTSYSFNDGMTWNPIGVIGFHTLSVGGNKRSIWAAGEEGKVAHLVEDKAKK